MFSEILYFVKRQRRREKRRGEIGEGKKETGRGEGKEGEGEILEKADEYPKRKRETENK